MCALHAQLQLHLKKIFFEMIQLSYKNLRSVGLFKLWSYSEMSFNQQGGQKFQTSFDSPIYLVAFVGEFST